MTLCPIRAAAVNQICHRTPNDRLQAAFSRVLPLRKRSRSDCFNSLLLVEGRNGSLAEDLSAVRNDERDALLTKLGLYACHELRPQGGPLGRGSSEVHPAARRKKIDNEEETEETFWCTHREWAFPVYGDTLEGPCHFAEADVVRRDMARIGEHACPACREGRRQREPILPCERFEVSMRHGAVKFKEQLEIFGSIDLLLTLHGRDDGGSDQDLGHVRRWLGVDIIQCGAFNVLRGVEQPRTVRLVEAPGLEIFDSGTIFGEKYDFGHNVRRKFFRNQNVFHQDSGGFVFFTGIYMDVCVTDRLAHKERRIVGPGHFDVR